MFDKLMRLCMTERKGGALCLERDGDTPNGHGRYGRCCCNGNKGQWWRPIVTRAGREQGEYMYIQSGDAYLSWS